MQLLPADYRCGFSSFPDWCDLGKQITLARALQKAHVSSGAWATQGLCTPLRTYLQRKMFHIYVCLIPGLTICCFHCCLACSVSQQLQSTQFCSDASCFTAHCIKCNLITHKRRLASSLYSTNSVIVLGHPKHESACRDMALELTKQQSQRGLQSSAQLSLQMCCPAGADWDS